MRYRCKNWTVEFCLPQIEQILTQIIKDIDREEECRVASLELICMNVVLQNLDSCDSFCGIVPEFQSRIFDLICCAETIPPALLAKLHALSHIRNFPPPPPPKQPNKEKRILSLSIAIRFEFCPIQRRIEGTG